MYTKSSRILLISLILPYTTYSHPPGSIQGIDSLALPGHDVEGIFGSSIIKHEDLSSECHHSIADKLQGRCGIQGTLGEAEKSGIAISFTLCSLSTALQPIPNECTYWTEKRNKQWSVWKSDKGQGGDGQRAQCLSALHRSPQDWMSYNRYLSDATQLCHALAGRWEAQQVKELYANATNQKISLLHHLKRNEEKREAYDEKLGRELDERIQAMTSIFETASQSLAVLEAHEERSRSTLEELRKAIIELDSKRAEIWQAAEEDGSKHTRILLADMEMGMEEIKESLVSGLASDLRIVSQDVEQSLSIRDAFITAHLDTTGARYDKQLDMLHTAAERAMLAVHTDLNIALMTLVETHQELSLLTTSVGMLNPALNTSLELASQLNDLQHKTGRSMKDAAVSSQLINSQLADVVLKINQSVAGIGEWQKITEDRSRKWAFSSFSVFSSPSLISAGSLQALMDHPLTGVAYVIDAVLSLAAQGFLMAVSLLGSMLFLLWSGLGRFALFWLRRLSVDWSGLLPAVDTEAGPGGTGHAVRPTVAPTQGVRPLSTQRSASAINQATRTPCPPYSSLPRPDSGQIFPWNMLGVVEEEPAASRALHRPLHERKSYGMLNKREKAQVKSRRAVSEPL